MIRPPALLLALTLALAACSSSGTAEAGTAAPRRNANVITMTELQAPDILSLSLFDVITRLRPTWLRQRGATSISGGGGTGLPEVMLNDSPSSLDQLRGMRASDATELQYMSAADATTLYGTGYVNGLIKIKTGGLRVR